jgi:hypothetical protein
MDDENAVGHPPHVDLDHAGAVRDRALDAGGDVAAGDRRPAAVRHEDRALQAGEDRALAAGHDGAGHYPSPTA